jgi:hypothetical protein
MPQYAYIIICVAIIVFFVALFFITFVINRRTPVPKGCEHIKIDEDVCGACNVTGCSIKEKFDIEKLKKEIEEEDK